MSEKYKFIKLIKSEKPDFYILYEDISIGKSFIKPIEITTLNFFDYKGDGSLSNYKDIQKNILNKLDKYDSYSKNSNDFVNKNNEIKKIKEKFGDNLIIKEPTICFFPCYRRICKYELLSVLNFVVKKLAIEDNIHKDKLLSIIDCLKNDIDKFNLFSGDTNLHFFYINSFYFDTIIFLLNKKIERKYVVDELVISFKNLNFKKSIFVYSAIGFNSDEEKNTMDKVIKVLECEDNILEDNVIKNIHCKNDGDIESITIINW